MGIEEVGHAIAAKALSNALAKGGKITIAGSDNDGLVPITAKREKMLRHVIFEAVNDAQTNLLGERIDAAPDMWDSDTVEMYDAFTELEHALVNAIFNKVFRSNHDSGAT